MNAKTYQTTNSFSFAPQAQVKSGFDFNQLNAIASKNFLPTIESIATGNPDYVVRQSQAARVVAGLPNLEKNRDRIEKLYNNTRIDTRHLAVNLLTQEAIAFSQHGSIQARMQMYKDYAIPLAERVAKKALLVAETNNTRSENIADSIGLIVFVSSTGFVAPGIDAALIERLKLRRDTARVTVNFMGCAAAMNGLQVASDYVRSHPTNKALVVCLELSSINAVFDDEVNDVIIHSIFGDGCAAVVVGACTEEQAMGSGKVVIKDHLSYLIENTEDGIVLGVRERGITCQLSRQLPDYIENGVNPIIENFLARNQLRKANVDLWAVHPGGTRIIEKAQRSLGLSDRQLADSWEILRQHGNMLSPSVLFVMERMLFSGTDANKCQDASQKMQALTGIAFSFSPGVGIEGILFQKI